MLCEAAAQDKAVASCRFAGDDAIAPDDDAVDEAAPNLRTSASLEPLAVGMHFYFAYVWLSINVGSHNTRRLLMG